MFGLLAIVGPRSAEPSAALHAERLVRDRAAVAVAELDALRAAVQPGFDDARAAAAGVVSGAEAPSERLEAAAARIADGERAVAPALRAVAALDSALLAWHPDAPATVQPVATGELISIARQLEAAGPAADTFADLRGRGSGLPGVLEDALSALERGAIEEAEAFTAQARADHDAIVAWETDLPTLPVWVETTDAMIGAVEQILDATRAGDAAAADRAAAAFAALADDAATADRALRIALSEGGASVTAAPLGRLASALRGIETARAAVSARVPEPDE